MTDEPPTKPGQVLPQDQESRTQSDASSGSHRQITWPHSNSIKDAFARRIFRTKSADASKTTAPEKRNDQAPDEPQADVRGSSGNDCSSRTSG